MRPTAFAIQPIGLLLTLSSLCIAASAQSTQPISAPVSASALVPGATVRIRLEGESEPIVGVVQAATADSFLIESGPQRQSCARREFAPPSIYRSSQAARDAACRPLAPATAMRLGDDRYDVSTFESSKGGKAVQRMKGVKAGS